MTQTETDATTWSSTSAAAFAHAEEVIPGGVNSPVRAFGAVGGTPRFIASAQGPFVRDVDGREYVDLVGSWGPALLGHAHPAVVAAVQEAAARGLGFGAPTTTEVELVDEIRARVAAAERVRLVSTGTEAVMTALRLARGATGRDLVVKFAGCYHGHVDALLAQAGSGLATFGMPGSAGVTAAQAAETIVLPYNDLAAVEAAFAEHGDRIAALITEAAPANMGVVPPLPGFNRALREITRRHGALLVQDEVMTGFRVGPAGWWGLEGRVEDWAPDLLTFGKVIGGGLPVAAVAGRAEVMDLLAPRGPVYQAGTLSGNPVATAAGLATLRAADTDVYVHVDAAAAHLRRALTGALAEAGVPHAVQWAGSLFSVVFGEEAATRGARDYASVQASEHWRYAPFFHALLEAGVSAPPSAFEAWFVSASHDEAALDRVIEALPAAARAAAAAEAPEGEHPTTIAVPGLATGADDAEGTDADVPEGTSDEAPTSVDAGDAGDAPDAASTADGAAHGTSHGTTEDEQVDGPSEVEAPAVPEHREVPAAAAFFARPSAPAPEAEPEPAPPTAWNEEASSAETTTVMEPVRIELVPDVPDEPDEAPAEDAQPGTPWPAPSESPEPRTAWQWPPTGAGAPDEQR
ncbi:glutamate-1-semialdehyde 2,1-aminomutase [Cellulomonas oligotrophica]|uniref:Glutamate-1-semialdehyde 2,1-aminomutase n=1 Tax=Cellulomonas oligotrophica TaxID=931536 RepID=A0A7Y9FFN6_9CELL|nr:glutamate-1-semialdehyde 2,1-aminomutase [Cellulomonas oligotrophica]GIG32669.1 hypothetical protein Col01nite_18280 [Cellulomonas oligotrophica]